MDTKQENGFKRFKAFLLQPVDIAPLILLRIGFGLLGFIDVLSSYLHYHVQLGAFDTSAFQFPYIGFEWIQAIPDPYFSIIMLLSLAGALGIIFGYKYRLSAVLFWIGFTYLFFLEKSHYLNHGYLFIWIGFLMIFLPADRAVSLRTVKQPEDKIDKVALLYIFPFIFMMSVVYFYGGLAKINPDWLRAQPLTAWLSYRADRPIIGGLVGHEWAPWILSYGGLIFDLSIAFIMLTRPLRRFGIILAFSFHFTNLIIFNIGIFPWLSMVLTLLYFPAYEHRRFWIGLSKKVFLIHYFDQAIHKNGKNLQLSQVPHIPHRKWQPYIFVLLILGMTIHLTIPFRHHLYEGDVAWTEEGHRYSWRMKLRSKRARGYFEVVNTVTEERQRIYPPDSLRRSQSNKLLTHPDMIWQYAQHLKACHGTPEEPVQVFARISAKLNDHPFKTYVDPEADLANFQWSLFKPTPWIMRYTD